MRKQAEGLSCMALMIWRFKAALSKKAQLLNLGKGLSACPLHAAC